jgi:endonuclease YncB( thermonuclease family)
MRSGGSSHTANSRLEDIPVQPFQPKNDCCTRVVDGSTIEVKRVDGTKAVMRLAGIAAPQREPAWDTEGTVTRMYTSFVSKFLLGKRIRFELESPNAKDRDGNILVYVFRIDDGKLANEELIASGYAEVNKEYPFKMQEQFCLVEKQARSNFRGIWGYFNKLDEERKQEILDRQERRKRQIAGNDKIAKQWMAIGANLEKRNPTAAQTWYQKVIDKYPDVPSANDARQKLKSVPEPARPKK